ncbi:hypothetical protein N185_29105 [Sinorhizobium sp. GW3]|nr:hypothetical protein N185_29105 [Sinorhizobium sp. GW3]
MISYSSRYTDAAGIGQAFKPSGDVDPIPEDIAVSHQNIADVDPDAEVHLVFVGKRPVGTPHGLLDGDRTVEGMHNRWEFRQHAVPRGPEDLSMSTFNKAVDDSTMRCQGRQSLLFVGIHQPRVTFDIRSQDRCKLSFKWWRLHVNDPIQRVRFDVQSIINR